MTINSNTTTTTNNNDNNNDNNDNERSSSRNADFGERRVFEQRRKRERGRLK